MDSLLRWVRAAANAAAGGPAGGPGRPRGGGQQRHAGAAPAPQQAAYAAAMGRLGIGGAAAGAAGVTEGAAEAQREAAFPLLDLPDLALSAVLHALAAEDPAPFALLAAACSCKRLRALALAEKGPLAAAATGFLLAGQGDADGEGSSERVLGLRRAEARKRLGGSDTALLCELARYADLRGAQRAAPGTALWDFRKGRFARGRSVPCAAMGEIAVQSFGVAPCPAAYRAVRLVNPGASVLVLSVELPYGAPAGGLALTLRHLSSYSSDRPDSFLSPVTIAISTAHAMHHVDDALAAEPGLALYEGAPRGHHWIEEVVEISAEALALAEERLRESGAHARRRRQLWLAIAQRADARTHYWLQAAALRHACVGGADDSVEAALEGY